MDGEGVGCHVCSLGGGGVTFHEWDEWDLGAFYKGKQSTLGAGGFV